MTDVASFRDRAVELLRDLARHEREYPGNSISRAADLLERAAEIVGGMPEAPNAPASVRARVDGAPSGAHVGEPRPIAGSGSSDDAAARL